MQAHTSFGAMSCGVDDTPVNFGDPNGATHVSVSTTPGGTPGVTCDPGGENIWRCEKDLWSDSAQVLESVMNVYDFSAISSIF